MKQVILKLYRKNPEELVAYAKRVLYALNNNEHFPDADVLLAPLNELVAREKQVSSTITRAKILKKSAEERKKEVLKQLANELERVGKEVALVSDGNAVIAASAAMKFRKKKQRVGELPKVEEFTVENGTTGILLLQWKPVKGAVSYSIQAANDGLDYDNFRLIGACTAAKLVVKYDGVDWHHAQRYWFRVAALGAAGLGPWSEPVNRVMT